MHEPDISTNIGQLMNPRALPALRNALSDTSLHPVVRHEAAEAIGAIGDPSDRDFIAQFVDDPAVEVRFCIIAPQYVFSTWCPGF